MEFGEQRLISVSRQDWSFDRRGAQDEARHNEKVKDSIKDNLDNVMSDGNIITADPNSKKVIKIPLRSIELPRFRYGESKEGIGSGEGGKQVGDVVGHDGEGEKGNGAGDKPGEEYYEAELTIREIQDMVFEDLGLPRIKPKSDHKIESDEVVFNDVRKKRSPNNLDISRTVMQNMLRNAMETGIAKLDAISPEDYRVRTWDEEKRPENNAVVIAMADISGSMGEFEKYLTRAFCWWSVGFLRTKYPKVDIIFVAHDTEAYEVTEEQFFTRGAGGGTRCSSANKMALDMVENRYPPSRYNVYPLHFSDGDNWAGDNEACISLVQQMLNLDVNQYAYIQVGQQGGYSKLLTDYNEKVTDSRFKGLMLCDKADVFTALKQVFNPEERESR